MAMTDDPWNRFILRFETETPRDEAEAELFALFAYQSEVYNGGHHQFFWNRHDRPDEWTRALRGARQIGASGVAENLAAAIDVWRREEREVSTNALAFLNSAREGDFMDFDDRFYAEADAFQKRFEEVVAGLEAD